MTGLDVLISCLENSRDGGAWWVAIYGVTQCRTRLKWLSSSNRCPHKKRTHTRIVFVVVIYECESWTIKKAENWSIWTVVLEQTLESPLDCKIKLVSPKGNQPWIVIGRTDSEAEAPILWPPDVKSKLTGKDPDAGDDWRQEEKGAKEGEMAREQHRLNGHEFEQTLGDSEGQRSWCAAVHGVWKSWMWFRNWAIAYSCRGKTKIQGDDSHLQVKENNLEETNLASTLSWNC